MAVPSPLLIRCLSRTHLRNLKLSDVTLREVFTLEKLHSEGLSQQTHWSLQTLEIIGQSDALAHHRGKEAEDMSSLHRSILKLCAPSLGELELGKAKGIDPNPCSTRDPRTGLVPNFPRLLMVFIKTLSFADSCYVEAFLGGSSRITDAALNVGETST